jgi:hypothetical protein
MAARVHGAGGLELHARLLATIGSAEFMVRRAPVVLLVVALACWARRM